MHILRLLLSLLDSSFYRKNSRVDRNIRDHSSLHRLSCICREVILPHHDLPGPGLAKPGPAHHTSPYKGKPVLRETGRAGRLTGNCTVVEKQMLLSVLNTRLPFLRPTDAKTEVIGDPLSSIVVSVLLSELTSRIVQVFALFLALLPHAHVYLFFSFSHICSLARTLA